MVLDLLVQSILSGLGEPLRGGQCSQQLSPDPFNLFQASLDNLMAVLSPPSSHGKPNSPSLVVSVASTASTYLQDIVLIWSSHHHHSAFDCWTPQRSYRATAAAALLDPSSPSSAPSSRLLAAGVEIDGDQDLVVGVSELGGGLEGVGVGEPERSPSRFAPKPPPPSPTASVIAPFQREFC
ncbi:hypothetical protein J5N97_022616 [Dioscorea zingiberensis]|uniref:Uncharacterized protein n=1 Tax=Dioscorea zingiberensis TaxID=325984 RepID=A0A9D5HAT7_9LILI|nr:hypothetical protein J5N97_022616 [Dioscorea zingiberensis]